MEGWIFEVWITTLCENQEGTKKGPRRNQEGTKKEPKRNQKGTKKEPRKNQEGTKKEPRRNQEGTKKEPRKNQEGTKKEPRRNQEGTKKEPRKNQEGTKKEPRRNQEGTKKEPRRNQEGTKKEPRSKNWECGQVSICLGPQQYTHSPLGPQQYTHSPLGPQQYTHSPLLSRFQVSWSHWTKCLRGGNGTATSASLATLGVLSWWTNSQTMTQSGLGIRPCSSTMVLAMWTNRPTQDMCLFSFCSSSCARGRRYSSNSTSCDNK